MLESSNILKRLTDLRTEMKKADLDAFIIPKADEYLGEYVPEHNERLKWVSGFSGSAGVIVVLQNRALIFVDGRYTIQAKEQTNSDYFEYFHLNDEPFIEKLALDLPKGSKVGIDPKVHNLDFVQKTELKFAPKEISLIKVEKNLVDLCWNDRPVPVVNKGILLDQKYTGLSSIDKREMIGKLVEKEGADSTIITALDSIAWLLNIRGKDISCFCVTLGSAILNYDGSMIFFTDENKLPDGFFDHVGKGVKVKSEEDSLSSLQALGKLGLKVLTDPIESNAFCQLAIQNAGGILISGADPVALVKACKNPVELEGMKKAHIRDGVSMVKFLSWLEEEVARGKLHNEAIVSDKVDSLRRESENFRELSFNTISASASNAAMCHYDHTNGIPADLEMNSMFLLDSGGHYLDGTTDITRTVAIGTPTSEQRKMFTLVMKGHIALDQIRFPKGTNGGQLDSLARQYLWQQGYDFDHGTGHGVGCFLNVHEGPHRIGKNSIGVALQPGMVTSNEPGYYREGEFGIRCENLIYVVESDKGCDGKTFYEFERLTHVPFDLKLVDPALLTANEIDWFNNYHISVRNKLSKFLNGKELDWLNNATRAI